MRLLQPTLTRNNFQELWDWETVPVESVIMMTYLVEEERGSLEDQRPLLTCSPGSWGWREVVQVMFRFFIWWYVHRGFVRKWTTSPIRLNFIHTAPSSAPPLSPVEPGWVVSRSILTCVNNCVRQVSDERWEVLPFPYETPVHISSIIIIIMFMLRISVWGEFDNKKSCGHCSALYWGCSKILEISLILQILLSFNIDIFTYYIWYFWTASKSSVDFKSVMEPCDHSDGRRYAIIGAHELMRPRSKHLRISIIDVLTPKIVKDRLSDYFHDFALCILELPVQWTEKGKFKDNLIISLSSIRRITSSSIKYWVLCRQVCCYLQFWSTCLTNAQNVFLIMLILQLLQYVYPSLFFTLKARWRWQQAGAWLSPATSVLTSLTPSSSWSWEWVRPGGSRARCSAPRPGRRLVLMVRRRSLTHAVETPGVLSCTKTLQTRDIFS